VSPFAPDAPVEPVAPVAPDAPVEPVAPVAPVAPVSPLSPLGPCCPMGSTMQRPMEIALAARIAISIPAASLPVVTPLGGDGMGAVPLMFCSLLIKV